MSRLGGAFWFVLVIATGVTNFVVKQTVQNLDDELANVRRKTIAEQKEIHELSADWTFLNQPELLADLNKRYVGLASVSPKQIVAGIDSLPLRPVAPPPPDAPPLAPVIAAPPPPTAPQVVAVTPLDAPPAPTPVGAPVTAPGPIVRVAAAPAPAAASLDALFAQVAGGH